MKPKISVIGVGRLGLSFALLLDSKGYDVFGCDVNEKYIESLINKSFVSKEPGITEMLRDANVKFTTSAIETIRHSDIIFVFVPTPSKANGEYDHIHIEQVVNNISNVYSGVYHKTLIIGCTVMPGYCQSIKSRLSALRVDVVYNPSFIAQGTICDNIKTSDIVLIGGKYPSVLHYIYNDIMDIAPNIKCLSLIGAEIAKISLNCFLTTKISFANRIAEICINSGIEKEVPEILKTIGNDRRVGNHFLRYGYGFSGVCLPRDNRALGVHAIKVGVSAQFQEMVDMTNKQHLNYLHNYFVAANPDKERSFVFYQLSYKTGVDILTESQPLSLCLLLLEDGYRVSIIESESVIEQAKYLFKKYENRVSYGEDKSGFVINLL